MDGPSLNGYHPLAALRIGAVGCLPADRTTPHGRMNIEDLVLRASKKQGGGDNLYLQRLLTCQ